MNILLAFAPFLAFALVDRALGSLDGLVAGAIVSLVMLGRDTFLSRKSPKVLEVGTFILFCALAVWFCLFRPEWSVVNVRLRVDLGLLLIVLISMLIRQPFTLQYAREGTPRDLWSNSTFIRTNYVITAVWAAAFAVLVFADLLWVLRPDLSPRIGVWATIAALIGAVKFTSWYPKSLHRNESGSTTNKA